MLIVVGALHRILVSPARGTQRSPQPGGRSRTVSFGLGSAIRGLALLTILVFGTEREARAYTDPGTGALVWQMLVAGFVGALFYFRRFSSWVKRKRSRGGQQRPDVPSGEENLEV